MELSKSRLSALVVGSTAAGHLMSSGPLDLTSLASALGGTFLLAGSANSFNQIIETRNDAAMNRTHKRPLPSGRISRPHAIGWASASGAAGLATLALGTNCMTTALGAATLGLYTLAYTPMKQRTPLNTWVGAVVGAIPPVMGWTAAGGGLITLEAAVLGSSLFLWHAFRYHFLVQLFVCTSANVSTLLNCACTYSSTYSSNSHASRRKTTSYSKARDKIRSLFCNKV